MFPSLRPPHANATRDVGLYILTDFEYRPTRMYMALYII